MKKIFFLSLLMLNIITYGQLHRHNPHACDHQHVPNKTDWYPVEDPNYDVLFYHIDVEIAVDSIYISGAAKFLISSNIDNLSNKVSYSVSLMIGSSLL